MKLTEMKKIAEARTRREWDIKDFAKVANSWDKLIAVIEAAKNLFNELPIIIQMAEDGSSYGKLRRALEDLEK